MAGDRVRVLSREDIAQVVQLYRQGHSQRAIAERFGVTPGAINYQLSKKLARPMDHQHCPTCTCHTRGT